MGEKILGSEVEQLQHHHRQMRNWYPAMLLHSQLYYPIWQMFLEVAIVLWKWWETYEDGLERYRRALFRREGESPKCIFVVNIRSAFLAAWNTCRMPNRLKTIWECLDWIHYHNKCFKEMPGAILTKLTGWSCRQLHSRSSTACRFSCRLFGAGHN